jgi:hypothetical protein
MIGPLAKAPKDLCLPTRPDELPCPFNLDKKDVRKVSRIDRFGFGWSISWTSPIVVKHKANGMAVLADETVPSDHARQLRPCLGDDTPYEQQACEVDCPLDASCEAERAKAVINARRADLLAAVKDNAAVTDIRRREVEIMLEAIDGHSRHWRRRQTAETGMLLLRLLAQSCALCFARSKR